MKKMNTPSEWTTKTYFHPQSTVSDDYNFDKGIYSEIPTLQLDLCWQPVDDSTSIQERGATIVSSYTAVVYDNAEFKQGDMVMIEGLGCFLITSIRKYLSYRLVTIRSTDRRITNV